MCRLYSHSKSAYLPQIRAPIPTGIFRPTGVLISAKSAAIGYPIRMWMFSISPMLKVRSAEAILTQPLFYIQHSFPPVESFNGCDFCKVCAFVIAPTLSIMGKH